MLSKFSLAARRDAARCHATSNLRNRVFAARHSEKWLSLLMRAMALRVCIGEGPSAGGRGVRCYSLGKSQMGVTV